MKNKKVLVSGATGYLGRSMALALAAQGASVTLLGRNQAKLTTVLESDFQLYSSNVNIILGSLESLASAQGIIDQYIAEYGIPDLLVNCVGAADDAPFVFHTTKDIQDSFTSNLFSITNLCSAILPKFVENSSGNIINFTSITGLVGQPMRSLYGASKGAVIAYSKSIARRYAVDNIRVNCIAPQVVAGGLADNMNADVKSILQGTTPIKRECVADDLISPMMMLANEQQGFITGEVVNVTGGLVTW